MANTKQTPQMPVQTSRWRPKRLVALLGLFLVLLALPSLSASAKLRWDPEKSRLDAQIENGALEAVLLDLALATGWQIYLEPGTEHVVSAKFTDLPSSQALRLLLGNINYALIPQKDAPPKLLIFRSQLDKATRLIAPVAKEESALIENELILQLKPGSDIEAIAKQLDATVVGKVEGLNAYRLQFKDGAAADAARKKLEAAPEVGQIDSNYRLREPTPSSQGSVPLTPGFNLKPAQAADGKIIVAMLDTPVQRMDERMEAFLLPTLHIGDQPGETNPHELSHGTSMAQIILQGLAANSPEAADSPVRVLPVNIYGDRPHTTTFDIAHGVYAAMESGASIVNLSLGGEGDSLLLRDLIQQGRNQGILFFGSAGNAPTGAPVFPAAYPEVIAVTAGDKRGNLASYANYAPFVDVIAPGVSIVEFNGDSYFVTGTSASTALVAGSAAGLQSGGLTPDEIEALIRQGHAVRQKP